MSILMFGNIHGSLTEQADLFGVTVVNVSH